MFRRNPSFSFSLFPPKDLLEAKDKVSMGAIRKSLVRTELGMRRTAYHEGGHALAALLTPGARCVGGIFVSFSFGSSL